MFSRKAVARALRSVVLACVFLSPQVTTASTLSPEAAVELLARSQAANSKCHILEAQDTAMLLALVSEAEISLSEKTSEEDAAKTVAKGGRLGSSVKCDATTLAAVKSVLNAARQAAMATVPSLRGSSNGNSDQPEAAIGEDPSAASVPAEADMDKVLASIAKDPGPTDPKPVTAAQKKVAPAKIVKRPPAPVPAAKKIKTAKDTGGLESYGAIAERYYVARRCRVMSKADINSLYSRVLSAYRSSVASYGASSVAQVQRRAESNASAQGC